MKILIDSREQLRLEFKHPWVEEIEVRKLPVGDYAVEYKNGTTPPIYFERKSLPDLFGTFTSGITRFKKEVNRAADNNYALILIVEKPWTTIKNTNLYRGMKVTDEQEMALSAKLRNKIIRGSRIIKTIMTYKYKHNLGHVFCRNRVEMAEYIVDSFMCLGQIYGR